MNHETDRADDAGRDYSAAYAAHYANNDLRAALGLYEGVIASYPGTQEAAYSRSQIQNIVRTVVPEQEIFDADSSLARAHLDDVARRA